jgi:hypothetical protein
MHSARFLGLSNCLIVDDLPLTVMLVETRGWTAVDRHTATGKKSGRRLLLLRGALARVLDFYQRW